MTQYGALNNFHRLVGVFVEAAAAGEATVRLDDSDHLHNAAGTVHGGGVFTVADAAIATALRSLLDPGVQVATIEMKINFLLPARGELRARGKIIQAGKRIAVGESGIYDAEDRLVARAMATFAIIRGS